MSPNFSCHLMLTSSPWLRSFWDSSWRRSRQGVVAFCPQRQMGTGALDHESRSLTAREFGDITAFLARHDLFSQGCFEHFEHFSVYYQQFHVWREGRISNMINVFIERGWVGICLWAILSPALGLNTFWIFLRSLLEIANEVWATCIHATVIVSGFFAPLRYVPWLHLSPWGNALDVNVPTLGAVTLKGKFH